MLSSPTRCTSNQVISRGKVVPKLAQRMGQIMGDCFSHSGAMSSLSLVQSWELQRPVLLVLSAVMLLATTGGFFGPSGMMSILNRTQSRGLQGSRLLLRSSAVHVAAVNARDSLWSTTVKKTTRMSLILVFCRGDILARELSRPAMLVRVQAVTFRAAQSPCACMCWQCDIMGCCHTGLCDVTICFLPVQQGMNTRMELGRKWVDGFLRLVPLLCLLAGTEPSSACELCPDSIQAAFSAVPQLGSCGMFPQKILLTAKW